jgi:tetratricopeptide (TPR) repeat protein
MQEEKDSAAQETPGGFAFKEYKATIAHSGFYLVRAGVAVFGVVWLTLLCSDFWFGTHVTAYGIPAVLAALLVTHLLLLFQESTAGCAIFSFMKHGVPIIVYRRWLRINDPLCAPGIRFGNRNVAWSAIDRVDLTFWGNLVVRSSIISGEPESPNKVWNTVSKLTQQDVVLKIPFAIADYDEQTELVEMIKRMQPNVVINDRLKKRLQTKELKAATYIPLFGVAFMLIVLLDVGYSTFSYLDMLKGYYLADTAGIAHDITKGTAEFNDAENIRLHPLPIDFVSTQFMLKPPVVGGIYDARSLALWSLGRREEAIDDVKKALKSSPKSDHLNLRLARMLVAENKDEDAQALLKKMMEYKTDSFVPQMYVIAMKQRKSSASNDARAAYNEYRTALSDDLFKDNPRWPPGNNLILHDTWTSEDIDFVYDRLLGKPLK